MNYENVRSLIPYANLPAALAEELALAVLEDRLEPAGLASLDFDLADYGRRLGDWHDGQGDPIYAVGSVARIGAPHPSRAEVAACLATLERIQRNGVMDESADHLVEVIQETRELLAKVYPAFVWNGDEYGTVDELVSDLREVAARSISETSKVTRGGVTYNVRFTISLEPTG